MSLRYEGSDGSVIDLMSNGIYAQEPESLVETKWSYTTQTNVGRRPTIRQLYREAVTKNLTLSIMADSRAEFNEIQDRLNRSFEKDIRSFKPGKIWWDDYYLKVYAVKLEFEDYEELFESIEESIEFLVPNQYWISEKARDFIIDSGLNDGLDYSFDYMFDYDDYLVQGVMVNDSMFDCDFEMMIHGPCINPLITINGHKYKLTLTVETGQYVLIDSVNRKIWLVDNNGVRTNAFSSWKDKSNYIFQQIPVGELTVLWDQTFIFTLNLLCERNIPIWM